MSKVIGIPSTGDEMRDFEAIEAAAVPFLQAGYEPLDAEPGEYLVLRRGVEDEVEIVIEPVAS